MLKSKAKARKEYVYSVDVQKSFLSQHYSKGETLCGLKLKSKLKRHRFSCKTCMSLLKRELLVNKYCNLQYDLSSMGVEGGVECEEMEDEMSYILNQLTSPCEDSESEDDTCPAASAAPPSSPGSPYCSDYSPLYAPESPAHSPTSPGYMSPLRI